MYGLALIPLEDNFKALEWCTYIGVNFRFDDFDNRLEGKRAYKSWRSRFSVMVGVATSSNMEYRGQKLENTHIGFKPLLGLNFEPFKRFTVGGGIISFIPAPVGNTQEDTKIRPYISVGFDFNLFNYLIQQQ
jgi:hypothetical protein